MSLTRKVALTSGLPRSPRSMILSGWGVLGHTAEHDATTHDDESLAVAACVIIGEGFQGDWKFRCEGPLWALETVGEHDRVQQLVRAGALIAAEIDRLQGTRVLTRQERIDKTLSDLVARFGPNLDTSPGCNLRNVVEALND